MTTDLRFEMTIDGRGVSGHHRFAIINPATETIFAEAPDASREDLDAAVEAARRAFPAWRDSDEAQRQTALRHIGEILTQHADQLARLLTAEQGKPLAQAHREVLGAALWCTRTAEMTVPVEIAEDNAAHRVETRHVPYGVVAALVPWNFPVLLAMYKVAPALLAGNTLVLKPSPYTPLTMLRIGELLQAALPAGVLNVVCGGEELGPWLTAHTGVDKISFTGSTATGKLVMAGAADQLKGVTLELGGNDAAIVLDDIDVEALAETLFWSAFTNSGQICIATKRMYIQSGIYDRLAAALKAIASGVVVGDGSVEGTQLGPLQNRVQFERVRALIADTAAEGHRFLSGGPNAGGGRPGYFVPVTIVDNPPDDSRVVREEAFGPVLPLLRFNTIDEVIQRANDSIYGLGGTVWTKNTSLAASIAERLEAGTVWINERQNTSPDAAFAGHKQSGFGVENSIHGLLSYTRPKTVMIAKSAQH